MSMPFYVAPEQLMKDKADYARKNIARGRPLIATIYDGGVLLAAENPSSTLRKISEIYDRIAFGAVGRFNEFDQLRVAGVRAADVKGYSYSREDVDARSLANTYAQHLGQVFTHEMKPMEVEILVAEAGSPDGGGRDQLFHILFDGTVFDEAHFSVLGGEAEAIHQRMKQSWTEGWDLATALCAAVTALAGPERGLSAGDIEVAVLERSRPGRIFRRMDGAELDGLLVPAPAPAVPAPSAAGSESDEPGEPGGDDGDDEDHGHGGDPPDG
ncbi:MAG: proteasome subunit alpha [Acidimicrobiales bacterium]